ncbi:hypothetical protein QQ054_09470 [Oscillatoria amoena NRMC-F 0135]|nr:hypothetical protein [Oscillatoria amoena NRMC-F 0135]
MSGGLHVCARAQIGEFTILIKGDSLTFGYVPETGNFVGLISFLEKQLRLLARHFAANEWLVFLDHLGHFLLDFFEVFRCEPRLNVEIVIKPVGGGRADVEKRLREKSQHRRRHHMGARVANFFQRGH